jgi:hypothetical protein
MDDRPSRDHFRSRFNRLKSQDDDTGGAELERIYDQGRQDAQAKPKAVSPIRPSRRRRRPDALDRGLEAINQLRMAAVARQLTAHLDAAKSLGVTLAPPSAHRKRRGQDGYGLTRAHQDADGVHAPAAALLLRLDGACWRGSAPYIAEGPDFTTGRPLLEPDQAMLIGVLFRMSQHPGRLVAPLTERDELIAREMGPKAVINPMFYEPVWSHPTRFEGCHQVLRDFAPRVKDPDVRRVVRALLKQPDLIGRIRQCDLSSCYRFFVDRSPTWATAPARGCPGTTHTVQLHKESHPPERTS